MKKLTYITGNKNKLEHFLRYADFPIEHVDLDLVEIQSLDVNKIIDHKAKEAFNIIKKPILIEDVSLSFNALGNLPGPLIKWFLEAIGTEGLCHLLNNYSDRSAVASVTFAFYDGFTMKTFYGEMHGKIADHPLGNGFGWTPIFIPKGYNKSYGEMTLEEQHKTSMRRIAVEKINKYIKQYDL
ncbi:MAG: non-canonical purine NTP pyrophosphatase [Candidatus Levyibacteriota bacterium]